MASNYSAPMESEGGSWVRGRAIGAGAFAAVHVAVVKSTGHVFAVKSVSLASPPLASFHSLESEIRVLKSLRSPYVVAYLGDDATLHSRAGALRNLHLEYMPGGTAADAAPAGEPQARALARCVAHALRYLHAVAGVVHCDVKGRNVLLGSGGRVAKLADFGAALRTADGGEGWRRNLARGTPLWMAPEVARGELPTPAADVWSLGCTVVEMVTGAQPWPDMGNRDAAGAMLCIGYGDEVPEIPAQLSVSGRDFVARCLRRDAAQRWTADELLRHPFLAKEGASVEPSPRGVLEWAIVEFSREEQQQQQQRNDPFGESMSSVGSSDDDDDDDDDDDGSDTEMMDGARERVRELASDGGRVLGWCSDGWELVLGSESCSVSCSCFSCSDRFHYSRCCKNGLTCNDGVGLVWKCILFDLYHFLPQLTEVNVILFLASVPYKAPGFNPKSPENLYQ